MAKSGTLEVKVLGNADHFERTMSGLGRTAGLAFAAVGAAAAAGAGALFAIGDNFNDVERTIRVGTGAVGDDLDGLMDSFRSVAGDIPAEFDQVAGAISGLNTLTGATGDTLEELSAGVLEASRLLGEDGVANAESFGQALTQWQMDAADGREALDGLFVATQEYGMGLDETIGHLTEYGSVLQNAGFSMEEAAGLMGQLEAGGLSVSRVMPGLNMAFRNWASEGKNSRDELDRVVAAMQDAGSETEALAIATDEFGAEGAQRLTTGIRNGVIDLEDLSSAMEGTSGSIEDAAADTDGFGEAWTRFKNNVLLALEPVATRVFDAVTNAMEGLSDWWADNGPMIVGHAERIGEVVSDLAQRGFELLRSAVAGAARGLESVVRFLDDNRPILIGVATAIGVGLVAAFTAWAVSAGAAAAATIAAAAPVIAIGVAVGALTAAVIHAYQNWDWFRSTVDAVASFLTGTVWPALQSVAGFITGTVVPAVQAIASHFAEVWLPRMQTVASFITDTVIPTVVSIATKIAEVASAVGERVGDIVGFITGIPGRISDTVSTMFTGIRDAIDGAKDWVSDRVDDVVGIIDGLRGRIRAAARGMWDGIKEAFRSMLNFIIRGWNSLQFKLPSYDGLTINTPIGSQTVIPGWEGPTLGVPQIPELHTGGIFHAPAGRREGLALLEDGEAVSTARDMSAIVDGVHSMLDELVELRAEVRRQTDRNQMMTRTA